MIVIILSQNSYGYQIIYISSCLQTRFINSQYCKYNAFFLIYCPVNIFSFFCLHVFRYYFILMSFMHICYILLLVQLQCHIEIHVSERRTTLSLFATNIASSFRTEIVLGLFRMQHRDIVFRHFPFVSRMLTKFDSQHVK